MDEVTVAHAIVTSTMFEKVPARGAIDGAATCGGGTTVPVARSATCVAVSAAE
jgi:hypothetical protein